MFKRDTAACYRILLEPVGRFFQTVITFVKYRANAVLIEECLLGRGVELIILVALGGARFNLLVWLWSRAKGSRERREPV